MHYMFTKQILIKFAANINASYQLTAPLTVFST